MSEKVRHVSVMTINERGRDMLTLFPEPTLFDGIEEGVHQIISIILWNLKRFFLDALVQTLDDPQNGDITDTSRPT